MKTLLFVISAATLLNTVQSRYNVWSNSNPAKPTPQCAGIECPPIREKKGRCEVFVTPLMCCPICLPRLGHSCQKAFGGCASGYYCDTYATSGKVYTGFDAQLATGICLPNYCQNSTSTSDTTGAPPPEPAVTQGAAQGDDQDDDQSADEVADQGAAQGTAQGTNQGAAQGADQGTAQGTTQGAVQGANPGAAQEVTEAAEDLKENFIMRLYKLLVDKKN